MRSRSVQFIWCLLLISASVDGLGCRDDGDGDGDVDADGDGDSDADGDGDGDADGDSDIDADGDGDGDGDSDADGDGDSDADADQDEEGEYVPTPESVELALINPAPPGEMILYNDWNSTPNAIRAVRPDGTEVVDVLQIARAWSFGVSRDGSMIAFSGANWDEGEHWGIPTLGDAIHYTWLYTISEGSIELLAGGGINDECHTFAPDGLSLFVCRRWDFSFDGSSFLWEGYQIARIDLATAESELLGEPGVQALSPQLTEDGSTLYYTQYELVGGSPHFSIYARDLSDGSEELVRDNARSMTFSPDWTLMAFLDSADASRIHVMAPNGSGEVTVTAEGATDPAFSPDGTRIAHLVSESMDCSHIEIVNADGSDIDSPTRVRSCTDAGEMITAIAWTVIP